jgi:hypothetical protein
VSDREKEKDGERRMPQYAMSVKEPPRLNSAALEEGKSSNALTD